MSVPDWMIDAPQVSVDDLAALVRRLARALRKAAPDNDLPDQAVDYLRRHHLDGSILRDTPPAQAADSTEPVARDPLQGASDWLKQALVDCTVGDIQRQLLIGYNRARRLFDSQPIAAEAVPPASCAPAGQMLHGALLEPLTEDEVFRFMQSVSGSPRNSVTARILARYWKAFAASSDARDAPRYRWLRENGAELFYASADLEGDALDAAVDAGMKEQGHD